MSTSASISGAESSDPSYPRVCCLLVGGKYIEGLANCPADITQFIARGSGVRLSIFAERPCPRSFGAH